MHISTASKQNRTINHLFWSFSLYSSNIFSISSISFKEMVESSRSPKRPENNSILDIAAGLMEKDLFSCDAMNWEREKVGRYFRQSTVPLWTISATSIYLLVKSFRRTAWTVLFVKSGYAETISDAVIGSVLSHKISKIWFSRFVKRIFWFSKIHHFFLWFVMYLFYNVF